MKVLLLFSLILNVAFAKELKINAKKSSVKFGIEKFKVGKVVSGKFDQFSGTVDYADGKIKSINGEVLVNSIDTEKEKRDQHLTAPDFFDAKKYPKMIFKSTSPVIAGKKGYILKGKLTIKDVTKDVIWTVDSISEKEKSVSFKIKETIDRYQYNIKWNKRMDSKKEESWAEKIANAAKGLIGKYVIDKDVKIELTIVADR